MVLLLFPLPSHLNENREETMNQRAADISRGDWSSRGVVSTISWGIALL